MQLTDIATLAYMQEAETEEPLLSLATLGYWVTTVISILGPFTAGSAANANAIAVGTAATHDALNVTTATNQNPFRIGSVT